MSATIDERVVQMEFDNKDFEKNVATTLTTLDKLKNALTFTKQREEIETLSRTIDSTSKFDGFGRSIDVVKDKFSALEIAGITAISKITSQAIDAGERMVKSLSIDQIASGFDKYAKVTTSVQTILAATREQGETMESVTEQVEKLLWFTDETSYSLVDMTDNISKFTSNGIALENATQQMQGIAVAAALAGANAESASHAMAGFSKAMGEGAMKRQQWNWIQTAHMDTMQFKQTLIDTAVELGTLQKVGEGVYETLEGNEVTISNFEEAMKDAWITTSVMENTLELYGAFSEELYKASNMTKLSTSEMLEALEDYQNGGENLNDFAQKAGVSAKELSDILDVLSQDTLELGNRSFRAAQEAKTFEEAIDAVKDAVSSGWMKTFELIFGNYEEAKVLWTDFANAMWDVFASSGETRNEILGLWKELGGREDLIAGISAAFNNLSEAIGAAKEGLTYLFPDEEGMANILADITKKFRAFTEGLKLSDEQLDKIRETFMKVADVIAMVLGVMKSTAQALSPLTKVFFALGSSAVRIVQAFKRLFDRLKSGKTTTDDASDKFDEMHDRIDMLADVLVNVIDKLTTFVEKLIDNNLYKFIEWIKDAVKQVKNFDERTGLLSKTIKILGDAVAAPFYLISKLVEVIKEFVDKVSSLPIVQQAIKNTTEALKDLGEKSLDKIKALVSYVKDLTPGKFFDDLKDRASKVKDVITSAFDKISEKSKVLSTIKEEVDKAINSFKLLTGGVSAHTLYDDYETPIEDSATATDNLKKKLEETTEKIKEFFGTLDTEKIVAIGFSITMIGMFISVWKLVEAFGKLTTVATGLMSSVTGVFTAISKTVSSYAKKQKSKFKELAESILILVAALAALVYLNNNYHDSLLESIALLGALAGGLIIFTAALSFISKGIKKRDSWKELLAIDATMLALSASVLILSAAIRVLADVDFGAAQAAILMIAEMAAIISLFTIVVTRFSTGGALKNLAVMVIVAFTINKFASAVKEIANANFKNAQDNIYGLIAIFGGIALVAIAAGRIGVFSAIGLFATLMFIDKMIPIIKKIIDGIDFIGGTDKILSVLEKHIDIIMVIGSIAAGMTIVSALFGRGLKDFGTGILFISVGLIAMSKAIDIIGRIDPSVADRGTTTIEKILAMFLLLALVLKIPGGANGVVKISVSIGIMCLALYPIAGAIYLLGKMDQEKVKNGVNAISQLMVCFALIVAASRFGNGKSSFGAIFALVVGISTIVAELVILTLLPTDKIYAATIAISAILLAFGALLLSVANLGNVDHPVALIFELIAVCALLAGMGAIMWQLSKLPWDSVLAAGGAMFLALAGIAIALSNIKADNILNAKQSVSLFVELLAILAPIVASLMVLSLVTSAVGWESLVASAVALDIVFVGIMYALSKYKVESVLEATDSANLFLELLSVMVPILAALAVLSLLTASVGWENIIASAIALDIVFTDVMFCLSKFEIGDVLGALDSGKLFLELLAILAPIVAALIILSRYGGDWAAMIGAAVSMGIVITVMGGVCALLSKLRVEVGPASKAALALGAFIDILLGIFGVTGGLMAWINDLTGGSMYTAIMNGLDMIVNIMGKVGELFGALVGGLVKGFTVNVMEGIGLGLSKFADAADPFISWVKAIDDDTVQGAKNLAATLGYFALAEFMDSIANILGITESSDNLAKTFGALGSGLKSFASEVQGIPNIENVKAATEVAEKLFSLPLPRKGGFFQMLFGEKSIENFDEETLVSFGKGLKNFSVVVDGITKDQCMGGINLAKKLFELDPPNQGGLISLIMGDNDFKKFDNQTLYTFGLGLKLFANVVTGVSLEDAQGGLDIAAALFELSPPNQGGFISWILGDNDFSKFNGDMLGENGFGGGIAAFVDAVTGLDMKNASTGIRIAERLFKIELPKSTTLFGGLLFKTGEVSLDYFDKKVLGKSGLGGGIAAFVEAVTGLDAKTANIGVKIAERLLSIKVPAQTSGLALLFANNSLAYFNKGKLGERGLGGGIAAFAQCVEGIDNDGLKKTKIAANILTVLSKVDVDAEGGIFGLIKMLLTGGTDYNIEKMYQFFGNMGQAVANFYYNIKDIDVDKVNSGISALKNIYKALTKLDTFKGTDISEFVDTVKNAGDMGVSSFCNAFENAQERIDNAIASFAASVQTAVNKNQPTINNSLTNMVNTGINSMSGANALNINTDGYSQVVSDIYSNSVIGAADNALTDPMNLQTIQDDFSNMANTGLEGLMDKTGFDMTSITSNSEMIKSVMDNGVIGTMANSMTDQANLQSLMDSAKEPANAVINMLDVNNVNSPINSSKLYQAGKNILDGLSVGLKDKLAIQNIRDNLGGAAAQVEQEWNNYWQTHSPSKLAQKDASYVMQGYALGFQNNQSMVVDSVSSLGDETRDAFNDATKDITKSFGERLDIAPVIKPELDLSNVYANAQNINSLFDGEDISINSRLGSVNAAIADFSATSLSSSDDIVKAIKSLHGDIMELQNAMSNLQVVMDSGTLVGAIASDMDNKLGQMATYRRRGI